MQLLEKQIWIYIVEHQLTATVKVVWDPHLLSIFHKLFQPFVFKEFFPGLWMTEPLGEETLERYSANQGTKVIFLAAELSI